MSNFKPCPFCGDKPHVFFVDRRIAEMQLGIKKSLYKVVCPKNCCMQSKFYYSEDEAFDTWNRRAGDE